MTELTIRQPGMSPVKADLPNGAYLIGAGRNCHIRLEHPDISGRHAQLVVSDNEINIMDLGSSNGTFIGGSDDPLFSNRMVRVSPGTVIRLGRQVELLISQDVKPAVSASAAETSGAERLRSSG